MGQILYLYEPAERKFRIFDLREDAPVPCLERLRLSVGEFARGAQGSLLWTDRRALLALDALAKASGVPFRVDRGFRRQPADKPASLSHHAAGTAFDIGLALAPRERSALRLAAVATGQFQWVEMPYASGTLLRLFLTRRFPPLTPGDAGPYVFLLQDLLLRARVFFGPLTGIFTEETARGVRRAQSRMGLPVTGRVETPFWQPLAALTKASPDAKMVLQIDTEQGSEAHGL